ncbi:AAC(3) family N-acetyltransferase [Vibrio sp. HN007]|uniref:AAC(3) family N-acetyltransferase n=1 Tax=Vibrio iocasae TaxID=3098914 RepID=UPI0035D48ED5
MYSKEDLVRHLKNLGVEKGDTVLVRASLSNIGRIERPSKKVIIDALLESVGCEGTIVGLAFTETFVRKSNDSQNIIFTKDTKPNTGALANLMLKHPQCKRSKHPTNSFVAIGKNAEFVVNGHDESSLSYTPISKLMELDGKMLLIGCVKDSPGFTTVHYAQQVLGLTKLNLMSGLFKSYYLKEGKKILFKRPDVGGCSGGFGKFYADYIKEGILKVGSIGDANSILINANDAYDVDFKKISENKKAFMCDDPLCITCRATWLFNIQELPFYIVRKAVDVFVNKVKR